MRAGIERLLSLPGALDASVWALLAALWLGVALRRSLRGEAPWVRGALALAVAYGVVVRLALSQDAPLNAWAYHRRLPAADALFESDLVVWLARFTHRPVHLTDVISWTNFAFAVVTPAVYFLHARYLLRDVRRALAAAFLVACMPHHIRFSRSDVQFVYALLVSSVTFVLVYGALTDPSRAWRRACLVLLFPLCYATYVARPENLVFAALDLGALALYATDAQVPRRRWWTVLALIVAAAFLAAWVFTFRRHGPNVRAGLTWNTLEGAWSIARSRTHNTLLNPAMMPPVVPALALLGVGVLGWSGIGTRALFLLAWLVGFFTLDGYVVARAPEMQARYHTQLLTPLVLLAAAGAASVLSWRVRAGLAVAAWVLSAPWLHAHFIRDVAFSEMLEYRFLRAHREAVPEGCALVEYGPDPAPSGLAGSPVSRWRRLTERRDPRGSIRATTVLAAHVQTRDARGAEHVSVAPGWVEAARTGACLYVYEGLACRAYRDRSDPVAPVCAAFHDRLRLQTVAEQHVLARYYDDPNSGRLVLDDAGIMRVQALVEDGDPLVFRLSRVLGLR